VHHTLNFEEFKELLKVLCLNIKSFDNELNYLQEFYNDALFWDRKLCSINHILSRILEQFDKEEIQYSNVIEYVYYLTEISNFQIQEGDIRFLDELVSSKSIEELSLEEELIITQNAISK